MSEKKSKSRIRRWTENIVKQTIKSPFVVAKDTVAKVNPFDKKINKEDVSDSGVESIRLANSGIKTVKKSIRTTKNTIKISGNIIQKTTAFTVKSPIIVSKFTKNVLNHIIASLMNPIIIIFIGLILIISLSYGLILILISGDNTNKSTRTNAVGLVNISSQYQVGIEYLKTSLENHQNDFNSLIDSFYYDYDDLTNSDLVYMERTDTSGSKLIYAKSFATDDRKETLKSEWNISLTEREFLAIAYVWLENEKNIANQNTGHGIYEVSYNQEVFDTIIEKCAVYNDTVYNGQNCPDENCTRHVEYIDNPDYYYALDKVNEAADNYNSSGGNDYWGEQYEYWLDILNNTPSTIEEVTYICEYKHDLHAVSLVFYDKETVMNALGFDDISKQWVELTEKGFENNPDIP